MQKQTQTKTKRQRQRQRQTHRDRHRERERDRQTERNRENERERERGREGTDRAGSECLCALTSTANLVPLYAISVPHSIAVPNITAYYRIAPYAISVPLI
eukprot:3932214-Rhodomonas_salina.1